MCILHAPLVLWDAQVEWGRDLAKGSSVRAFIELPDVGHCPQDEAPDKVNPIVVEWATRMHQEAMGAPTVAAETPA